MAAPVDDTHPGPDEEIRLVSPDYFRALEIPLLKGRFFTAADKLDAPPVVIINQALAERYWPNDEALGKRINFRPGKDRSGPRSSESSAICIIAVSINR